MRSCFALLFVCATIAVAGAGITEQKSNTEENLRGISAVSANIAWASGTHGTFLRTVDGGATWVVRHVSGAEALDFRDVEAFSAAEAYLLAAGPGEQSRIYKTTDAGKNWTLQFTNKDPKGFFDCMAFWDREHGIAVGDPVNGKFQLIKTENGGKDWKAIPPASLPPAIEGEGAFAASGTCIAVQGKKNVCFVTGGGAARVFHSSDAGETWSVSETPIVHGPPSAGIFSIAFRDEKNGVIAGGDYKEPNKEGPNLATTSDGGKSWVLVPLEGHNSFYYSSVAFTENGDFVLGGTGGLLKRDPTLKLWHYFPAGCNAIAVTSDRIFAVGGNGVIRSMSVNMEVLEPTGITLLPDVRLPGASSFANRRVQKK